MAHRNCTEKEKRMMELKACKLGKLAIAAFAAIIVFTATDNIAGAAPTATIEMSTSTPQVGKLIIFDGSTSICDSLRGCSYTWQWFWRSPDGTTTHLGGQMGRTPIITYTFDAFAASKPYVIVTLTVGSGRVRRSSTASVTFVVSP
jgi:hypothetical protein